MTAHVVAGSDLPSTTVTNILRGGAGDDVLDLTVEQPDGTAPSHVSNRLDGGTGNDTLSGSDGADDFVLRNGDGADTLTNFQKGVDHFVLEGGLAFADLSFVIGNGGTTIVTDQQEHLAFAAGVTGFDDSDFFLV